MARIARLVVPGFPHHVTQRGNRRQRTFFSAADYRAYLDLLAAARIDANVDIWAYCLMPNHVHFVVMPGREDSLSTLFRIVHTKYTRRINDREDWRGHLWQERFHSSVLDEFYLMAAVRYVELNPVRAKLCDRPDDWVWSSTRAHRDRLGDGVVTVAPMLGRVSDWDEYLSIPETSDLLRAIRTHARTGRPAGDDAFVDRIEYLTGRLLRRGKPGPDARVK